MTPSKMAFWVAAVVVGNSAQWYVLIYATMPPLLKSDPSSSRTPLHFPQ